MKRMLLAIAMVLMLAVLTACGDGDTVTDAPVTTDAPITTEAPVTTEIPSVTDAPAEDTSDTSENTGFDLPMVPV